MAKQERRDGTPTAAYWRRYFKTAMPDYIYLGEHKPGGFLDPSFTVVEAGYDDPTRGRVVVTHKLKRKA